MPLREQGAKEQGAVAQNAHISTTRFPKIFKAKLNKNEWNIY